MGCRPEFQSLVRRVGRPTSRSTVLKHPPHAPTKSDVKQQDLVVQLQPTVAVRTKPFGRYCRFASRTQLLGQWDYRVFKP